MRAGLFLGCTRGETRGEGHSPHQKTTSFEKNYAQNKMNRSPSNFPAFILDNVCNDGEAKLAKERLQKKIPVMGVVA